MIYLHRFIYAIIFIPLVILAGIIWLITFVVATPFYAIAYYIAFGNLVNDKQLEKLYTLITNPIFKFLKLIKPNDK